MLNDLKKEITDCYMYGEIICQQGFGPKTDISMHDMIRFDLLQFLVYLTDSSDGSLYPETQCLIGAGVVLDPKDFISELDGLESRGISTANLKIDPRAHVVMPWHIALDGLSENFRGNSDIGPPKRGIGRTYMD